MPAPRSSPAATTRASSCGRRRSSRSAPWPPPASRCRPSPPISIPRFQPVWCSICSSDREDLHAQGRRRKHRAVVRRTGSHVDLPPKFVIPGGTELSARLDNARAAIRRAERRVTALKDAGELPVETVLAYLNRASDVLFAMTRLADEAEPELFEGRR